MTSYYSLVFHRVAPRDPYPANPLKGDVISPKAQRRRSLSKTFSSRTKVWSGVGVSGASTGVATATRLPGKALGTNHAKQLLDLRRVRYERIQETYVRVPLGASSAANLHAGTGRDSRSACRCRTRQESNSPHDCLGTSVVIVANAIRNRHTDRFSNHGRLKVPSPMVLSVEHQTHSVSQA